MHCIKRIATEEGINGLFKGLVATILREVPCYAGQFGGYYITKRTWATYIEKVDVAEISMLGCFISGGVGGFTCWLVSYPQDIIKTKLQVARERQFNKYRGFVPDGGFIECS